MTVNPNITTGVIDPAFLPESRFVQVLNPAAKMTNRIENAAQRQAAIDWMAENPGVQLDLTLPAGRPRKDIYYPNAQQQTTTVAKKPKKILTKEQKQKRANSEAYKAEQEGQLTRSGKAQYKHDSYQATGDGRNLNQGRPKYKKYHLDQAHEEMMSGTTEWDRTYQKIYKNLVKAKDRNLDAKRIQELEDAVKTYKEDHLTRKSMGAWNYDKLNKE